MNKLTLQFMTPFTLAVRNNLVQLVAAIMRLPNPNDADVGGGGGSASIGKAPINVLFGIMLKKIQRTV